MKNYKADVVLLVYGKGGHAAQMKRYLNNQSEYLNGLNFISLTNASLAHSRIVESFYCMEARDKYSSVKNIFIFLFYAFYSFFQMVKIMRKYNVVGMISTGPGMAVIPALLCRLRKIKVVYFESWSRLSKKSIAGRFMHRIANVFFVQHETMKAHYPNSIYKGRL